MLNISGLKLPMIGDMLVGGDVFFVDSGADKANDGNLGVHPTNSPCATIAGAYALCTADAGDFIVVMPGHAETLTAVVSLNKAGVTIIGVGNGDNRPTITVNAAVDGWMVCANDQEIHNLKFLPGSSSTIATRLLKIGGGYGKCLVNNCHFQIAAAEKMYHLVTVKGSVGLVNTFKDCLFENLSTVAIPSLGTLNQTAFLVHAGDVDVFGCRFIDMGAQKKNMWQQCVMAGSPLTGEDLGSVYLSDCIFTCRGVAVTARAAAVSARISIVRCLGISTSSNTAVANIFQPTYANIVESYAIGAVNVKAAVEPATTQ